MNTITFKLDKRIWLVLIVIILINIFILPESLYYGWIIHHSKHNVLEKGIVWLVSLSGNPSAEYELALYACSKNASSAACTKNMRKSTEQGHPFSRFLLANTELQKVRPEFMKSALNFEIFLMYSRIANPRYEVDSNYAFFLFARELAAEKLNTLYSNLNENKESVRATSLQEAQALKENWERHCLKHISDPYCSYKISN